MSIKKLLTFLILILSGVLITPESAHGQAPTNLFGNITIASPNAAALGKYGDYPVSYNTGVPQIGIPIYNVKEGSLSVPISLSYHGSGLKVMETSSSVGAGWSLNAGGVITRSVIGAPDDRGHLSNTIKGHFSNYGYNNYLWDPVTVGPSPSCYSYPEDNKAIFMDGDFIKGARDGEPDLFFFNFNGYAGKFYFRDDRTPVIVPEEDFKIEPILVNSADNISGFIITTPDGVKYYFGKNQNSDGNIDAIEVTSPYTVDDGLTSGNAISSWYLNKIKTADAQFFIDFIYQPEKYSYYTTSMFPVADSDPNQLNKHFKLVKNYLDGARLSQINFSNGNIKFLPGFVRTDLGEFQTKTISDLVNTESRTLDTIKISDNLNCSKNYVLNYSYFIDNTSPLSNDLTGGLNITTDTKRLRLDSIREISGDYSQSIPPYKFTYTTPDGLFAPRRLTFGQDHWGFYNGKTNNTSLIPAYSVNDVQTYTGADRESSWPEIGYGSLNKIQFPTGGFTQFLFEPNQTWASYQYYSTNYITNSNIGPYIGQSQNQIINLNTTANRYKFVLDYKTDATGNSTGYASVAGIGVSKNKPHSEIVLTPGAGSQTYSLSQYSMTYATHDWATVQIFEIVPSSFQDNKVIGGLRIKSITKNNGITSPETATTFNYNSGIQSTGVLYSRPTYVLVKRNDILKDVGLATTPNVSYYGCVNPDGGIGYQKSPGSLRPMQTFQGNHLGYNKVEVTQSGNGKTLYAYYGSDYWDQNQNDVCTRTVYTSTCLPTIPNYPAAPLPFDFIRGELRYEAYYNESNTMLKDIFYYPVYASNPISTPAYLTQGNLVTYYNLFTSKKTIMTTVSNVYSPLGSYLTIIDSVFYESPYHHQVTRKVSINSKGDKLETKMKYAFDFRVPACDVLSDGWQQYSDAYSNAFNKYSYTLATCTNSRGCNCKWPVFQSYRYDGSIARKNYIAYRRSNFTDSINAYKIKHDSAKAVSDGTLKPVLELQDRYQNPVIETTVWKNNLLQGSTFNKYDFMGTYVYPSKLQSIRLSALSASFSPTANTNSTLTKDSRYVDETTVKFANGTLVEITAKDGITNAYIWGYNNNLPIVKAIGVDYATLQAAYTNASGNLAQLRSQALPSSAMLSTYTYRPLVGMTSETDANGKTTYYEYDSLQRLTVVRDQDKNILKTFCYSYAGQPENCSGTFYSTAQSITFTRNNCGSGFTAGSYTTTIAANSYSSLISIGDANQQAQNYLSSVGQNNANQYGSCTALFYNTQQTGSPYTRNNCGAGYSGGTYTSTAAANTYSSASSVADANQKAQNYLSSIGQSNANQYGSCTPVFYNTQQSSTYTRNNCGSGYTGGSYATTVIANTYSSSVSVADANLQAQNYLSSVGQNNANQNGSCTALFYNTEQSGTYTRNDCGSGYWGGAYTTTIVANSFSSSVSVADANQQVLNYIASIGQNNANQYGGCFVNSGGGGQPIQE